jgi:hypothetical protein
MANKKPPLPPSCVTCLLVIQQVRGGRFTYLCSRTMIHANAARADPNDCGPLGKFWTGKDGLPATDPDVPVVTPLG